MVGIKKFIAVAAATACVLTSFAFTASAENIDDSLIVHYDFEGATEDERLSDKAGSTNEKLQLATTLNSEGEANTYIDNGVAYITDAAVGNHLVCKEGNLGDDIRNSGDKLTVFAAFRASGTAAGWAEIFNFGSVSRMFFRDKVDVVGDPIAVRYGTNKTNNALTSTYSGGNAYVATVVWTEKTSDGTYKMFATTYFSNDAGVTWATEQTVTVATGLTSGKIYVDKNTILIGRGSETGANSSMVTIAMEDFRVYADALTLDQIKTIEVKTHDTLCVESAVAAVENGMTVPASTETAAVCGAQKQIEDILNNENIEVTISDAVYTAGESLVCNITYGTSENGELYVQKNAEIALCVPTAKVVGTQTSAVSDGKYSIRFIGSVEGLAYEGTGLEITNGKKTWETSNTGVVYSRLTGNDGESGIIEYTPEPGSYFTAYTICGIPQGTSDSFTVRAFTLEGGAKVYGDTVVISIS